LTSCQQKQIIRFQRFMKTHILQHTKTLLALLFVVVLSACQQQPSADAQRFRKESEAARAEADKLRTEVEALKADAKGHVLEQETAKAQNQVPTADLETLKAEVARLRTDNDALKAENQSQRRMLAEKASPTLPPQAYQSTPVRSQPVPSTIQSPPQTAAKQYWLTSSSSKRHNSSCRYYGTSKGRACGPTEGVACKICGG
jgi:regulator of replication initiation timing